MNATSPETSKASVDLYRLLGEDEIFRMLLVVFGIKYIQDVKVAAAKIRGLLDQKLVKVEMESLLDNICDCLCVVHPEGEPSYPIIKRHEAAAHITAALGVKEKEPVEEHQDAEHS